MNSGNSKRVYISADYDPIFGDREVVDELISWSDDPRRKVDFVDMAKVVSGTVANDPDCRICDLKKEFNQQINASSSVIIVVGDRTASRTAGSACRRMKEDPSRCTCSPYKQNANGQKQCKVSCVCTADAQGDVGPINSYSYLRHEYEQAKRKNKQIVVLYNSTRCEANWLPSYLKDLQDSARPFWVRDCWGKRVGDYGHIKEVLGF